jgi:hypothetical protein
LRLLLTSEEARDALIPELKTFAEIDQFATRRIFQTAFTLHETGAPFGLSELDARLEDADRSRLASIALSDETSGDEISLQLGTACLEKLRRTARETELGALRTAIRDAERAGNFAEAMRLYEKLHALEKSRRAADVQ